MVLRQRFRLESESQNDMAAFLLFFFKKRKSKSRLIGQNVGLPPWFAQEASLGDDDKKNY